MSTVKSSMSLNELLENNDYFTGISSLMKSNREEMEKFINNIEFQSTSDEKITAQAFWWGFHVTIPKSVLTKLDTPTEIAEVLAGLMGTGFAEMGVPPVAVMISVLVVIFTLYGIAIRAIDKGNGVDLSWCWLQVPLLPVAPPYPVVTSR